MAEGFGVAATMLQQPVTEGKAAFSSLGRIRNLKDCFGRQDRPRERPVLQFMVVGLGHEVRIH